MSKNSTITKQMLQLKLAFLQICNTFYLEGLSEQLSDWSEYEYLVRKVSGGSGGVRTRVDAKPPPPPAARSVSRETDSMGRHVVT